MNLVFLLSHLNGWLIHNIRSCFKFAFISVRLSFMSRLNVDDRTPSQAAKSQHETRSLGDVISSCDKLVLTEQALLSASIDSNIGSDSARHNSTSWVTSFHDKVLSKTPGRSGTPRQLNFNTPRPKEPERPSPVVNSVFSDRWCLDSMTPGMRYTPPNMAVRGMRVMGANREGLGGYRLDDSRGASMCILPTPFLGREYSREYFLDPSANASPIFLPSRPSPVISAFASPTETAVIPTGRAGLTPTPMGPQLKKHRAGFNPKHFPIPRPSEPKPQKLSGLFDDENLWRFN